MPSPCVLVLFLCEGKVANYLLVGPETKRDGVCKERDSFLKERRQTRKWLSHQYSQSGKIQRAEIDGAATVPWSGFHASRHYVTAGGYVDGVCTVPSKSLNQTYESYLCL